MSRLQVDTFASADGSYTKLKIYRLRHLDAIQRLGNIAPQDIEDIRIVAQVLPFQVNEYVLENLIDWSNYTQDPMFRLVFPHKSMLTAAQFSRVQQAMANRDKPQLLARVVAQIRRELNPHPSGQQTDNALLLLGSKLEGIQHKYRETVLLFPSQAQTCHSYCSFCFRWAQFVGDNDLKIALKEGGRFLNYLKEHREITDVLVTGGDPMVMKTRLLKRYLEPLLEPAYDHIRTIRIGTKSLTFWPQRFLTDNDANELLALLKQLSDAGKHVAIMAHFNHWVELEPQRTQDAIAKVLATGAKIRSQGPLLAHINDSPKVWAKLWQRQVELGVIPYYMFVERDTGANRYFSVPLIKAWNIYKDAIQQVSGLARTVRGPVMSAHPGKVEILGVTKLDERDVMTLRFIQARDASLAYEPFFAEVDESAIWFDQLNPITPEAPTWNRSRQTTRNECSP